MDARTPNRSHVVRPAAMEWQKTRFPGCEIKTLLFDPASGLVTVLTRFARGAVLPDAHFAAVYAKPLGRALVDTFITEVSQDTWIYFPWDTGLAFQPPIREHGL